MSARVEVTESPSGWWVYVYEGGAGGVIGPLSRKEAFRQVGPALDREAARFRDLARRLKEAMVLLRFAAEYFEGVPTAQTTPKMLEFSIRAEALLAASKGEP